jgi:DNA-binding SARP family transcriptional activator/tetratricopeptide (TPR) repeat protein
VQVRRLLALLVAAPGRGLTVDRLVDELWPDGGPADPRKTLRVTASRLRTVLGERAECLVSDHEVYRLVGLDSDLGRFRRTVAGLADLDGPEAVVASAEEALGCWRAAPFADAAGPQLLDRVTDELRDQRLALIEQLADGLVRLGRFDRAVGLLAEHVDGQPHRELLAVPYARALAGVGRRGDALAALDRTRVVLRDRFGVDPGPEFGAVEREVLTGSVQLTGRARLEPSGPGVTAAPSAGGEQTLLDRQDALAQFIDTIGTPGVTVVIGEPGIGKSAFVSACRDAAAGLKHETHLVAVREDPRRPYEALSALIESALASHPSLEAAHCDVVARVFPDRSGHRGGDASLHTREALVGAAANLLLDAAPAERSTLIIDDAQWLDGVTHDVLALVIGAGRCRVVLASRSADPLAAIRPGDADEVVLSPLSAISLEALLRHASPRMASSEAAEDLARRSGGNPFFARLLVDLLAEGVDTDAALPATVLLAVQQRLDDLPRRLRTTLQTAAVAGGVFDCAWLHRLHPDACDDLLDAHAAGLIRAVDGHHFAFNHLLVAEAIRELTPSGRLMDLHDQLGEGMVDCGESSVAYARHFVYAAPFDADRAVTALLASARHYMAAFDWAEALGQLELAQKVQEDQRRPTDLLAVSVLLEQGRVLRTIRDERSAIVLFDAANAAIALDDTLFAETVVELCSHGRTLASGAVHPDARTLLGRALGLDLPPEARAQVCAASTALLALSNEGELARSLYHEALDIVHALEEAGNLAEAQLDAVRSGVYSHAHVGLGHPDDLELRVMVAGELHRLGVEDPELAWEAAFVRAEAAMVQAEPDVLDEQLVALRKLTPLVPGRPRDFGLALVEAGSLMLFGDLDGAEAAAAVALDIGLRHYPESWASTIYGSIIIAIRAEQGRLAEFRPMAQAWVKDSPEFVTWQVLAAVTSIVDGDFDSARELWPAIRRDRFAGLVPDLTWSAGMRFVAETAVALEDDDACGVARELLMSHAGRMHFGGACTFGPIDATLAMLADRLGDVEAAEGHRRTAAALLANVRPATTV